MPPARRDPSMSGPDRCRFLNEDRSILGAGAWNTPETPKLWLYNLHYFDDLNACDAGGRREWHEALIRRWVAENPPPRGNGWEPFPTSLRIVNWIKWALSGGVLSDEAVHSLAVQARHLERTIETYLLGNHLLANAKALVFAGFFFEGREADRWLSQGISILRREVPEQILSDGGHFERSPMYHSLVMEDLLDLVNACRAYRGKPGAPACLLLAEWEDAVGRMLAWLAAMCHPDGEIVLFNDSAFGIAPSPVELDSYADRLGFEPAPVPAGGMTHLSDSGYIQVRIGESAVFLDAAPLGPDYLPGHGHADTLTFEWSLLGGRVIVDSGTSRYDECAERLFQRGTTAHNTVTVDGADSSEVWGGFRVARRARPFGVSVTETDELVEITCSHDGYRRLPGKVVHRRTWKIGSSRLRIEDALEGRFRSAQARFLLHPAVAAASNSESLLRGGMSSGEWVLPSGKRVRWRIESGEGRFEPAQYHPGFGLAQDTVRLVVDFPGNRNVVEMTWD
jgi:uncharacterized heparinase superfamily protein